MNKTLHMAFLIMALLFVFFAGSVNGIKGFSSNHISTQRCNPMWGLCTRDSDCCRNLKCEKSLTKKGALRAL